MNVDTKIEEFASLRDGTKLVIQRWLTGPVERIWNYLTDSDLRRKWLAAGDMTLTPGAEFELIWRNDELSDASDPRPPALPRNSAWTAASSRSSRRAC